jgi:hypothetical protein
LIFRISGRKKTVESLPDQRFDPIQALRLLVEREVQLLFVYSEGNTGLDYALNLFGQEFDHLVAAKKVGLEIIPASDHLFTLLAGQEHLLNVIRTWVQTVQQRYQETVSVS